MTVQVEESIHPGSNPAKTNIFAPLVGIVQPITISVPQLIGPFSENTRVIEFHSDVDFFYRLGDNTVVATSATPSFHWLARAIADIGVYNIITGVRNHISILSTSGSGTIFITEMA